MNSRKSVTWSAVPVAPMLVYVRMSRWEGQRPRRGRWPMIPHRAIFSSVHFLFVDQWAWFEVWDARFGVLRASFEARAERSDLCLGGGDLDKWRFEKLIWGAKTSDYGSGRSDLRNMRPYLGSERLDWGSEKPALGFERLHFGSEAWFGIWEA